MWLAVFIFWHDFSYLSLSLNFNFIHKKDSFSIFLRNYCDSKAVDLYNTRKRNTVKEFWHNFSYLSISNILTLTSTCGSVRYKIKIQNREIQSKRVLGLTKYTHWLADQNKVTQQELFVESAHMKSKGVLILRTISCHIQKTDTTVQLYCTLSRYVIPKPISRQNLKTNTTPQLYYTLSM